MKQRKIGIALIVGLMAGGCGFRNGAPDGSGTIECTQVQVAPSVPGRIVALPAAEGMRLRKGELVAQLDPKDYELRRQELSAGLAQAQAQLDLIKAGAREEDVLKAKEQVREARAMAVAAAADLARIEQVFEQKSATRKQLDDARAQADRTAAVASGAEQVALRFERGNRPEEVRIAQAQVDQFLARLAQVEKALRDCCLVAPLDGAVTTRIREEGEYVAPGMPVVTLSRLDEVWVSIYVAEDRLAGVKLGQPARVRIDGDSRDFAGKVSFVSSEAEFTPKNVQTADERVKLVYRVKVTLPNPEGIFKAGMPADAWLGDGTGVK
jgi:HlyD family secretion protein